MKYRGLTWDKEKENYKWVYGLPSYGFETEEIVEIGTPYGDFFNIDLASLGRQTQYRDRHKKLIFTGDITILEVDGEVREFEVVGITMDREYNTLPGFEGKTVNVRLSGVIAFCWVAPDGQVFDLLPCVNKAGVSDTEFMEIIDTVAERAVRESESKSQKQ